MDRERLIKVLTRTQSISLDISFEIIQEYCSDKGKTSEEVSQLITLLSKQSNRFALANIINTALEYLEVKYNICKLISKDNSKILLIF